MRAASHMPLLWIWPLYLHVNKKSDDDDDDNEKKAFILLCLIRHMYINGVNILECCV